jgi:hypothetical protein
MTYRYYKKTTTLTKKSVSMINTRIDDNGYLVNPFRYLIGEKKAESIRYKIYESQAKVSSPYLHAY